MAPAKPRPSVLDPSVRFLYRYQPPILDRLRDVLLGHRLYFASPSQFKDPLDARPKVQVSNPEAMRRFIFDRYRATRAGDSPLFAALDQGNLQYRLSKMNGEQLATMLEPVFHQEMELHRICCMTTRPDNAYLWENYAADSTGVCFEFRIETMLGPLVDHALPMRVAYGDAPVLDLNDVRDYFLFRKTMRYEPEEEVRVLLLPRDREHTQPFDPTRLSKVIVGKNMAPGDRALIREWCQRRVPQLPVEDQHVSSALATS